MKKNVKEKVDVYTIVTERIIKMLEENKVPWKKPWKSHMPTNMISKKEYRGLNVFMLSLTDYSSNYWMTFKQVNQLGGKIKKGEKGYPVVYWKYNEYTKEVDGENVTRKAPLFRYYLVFNLDQTENIPEKKIPVINETVKETDSIKLAEEIVRKYKDKPTIRHDRKSAFYVLEDDVIHMPPKKDFNTIEDYYSTLFHEMIHSTGHKSRLDRMTKTYFGSEKYSKEEIVAELGASFLCNNCNIANSTIKASAEYIRSWIAALKNDKKLIVQASSKAQKAADYILGKKVTKEEVIFE